MTRQSFVGITGVERAVICGVLLAILYGVLTKYSRVSETKSGALAVLVVFGGAAFLRPITLKAKLKSVSILAVVVVLILVIWR
jgi:uncharacterized membrane protein YjfL (UPF0719 family)